MTPAPAGDAPVAAQQSADTAAHAAAASAAPAPPGTDLAAGAGPPPAFEAAAHQLAATQPALEGTHTGLAIGTTIQGGGDPAMPALSGGGTHIDLPPLDPMLLRYVGLAGFLALSLQAAARWTNAVSSCGVPTPLALRNFRLLPCLVVSSGERLADATVSLVSRTPSGPPARSVLHSGFGRRSASPEARSHGEAARTPASRSGASQLFEVVVLAALLAVNFVLISLRDVLRRETR
jgi:hypothetical protein